MNTQCLRKMASHGRRTVCSILSYSSWHFDKRSHLRYGSLASECFLFRERISCSSSSCRRLASWIILDICWRRSPYSCGWGKLTFQTNLLSKKGHLQITESRGVAVPFGYTGLALQYAACAHVSVNAISWMQMLLYVSGHIMHTSRLSEWISCNMYMCLHACVWMMYVHVCTDEVMHEPTSTRARTWMVTRKKFDHL